MFKSIYNILQQCDEEKATLLEKGRHLKILKTAAEATKAHPLTLKALNFERVHRLHQADHPCEVRRGERGCGRGVLMETWQDPLRRSMWLDRRIARAWLLDMLFKLHRVINLARHEARQRSSG